MMKKSLPKSIVLRWVLSYLLIFSIPVICLLYAGTATNNYIREEITSTNNFTLATVKKNLDTQVSELKSGFTFIFNDSFFKSLRGMTSENTMLLHSNASDLMKDLAAYVNASDYDLNFLIYFKKNQYIIAESTAADQNNLFYMQKTLGMDTPMEDWYKTLSARYSNSYFISADSSVGSIEPSLVYGTTVRGSYEDINIFISIPLSQIQKLANTLENRILAITDLDGNPIWCSDKNIQLENLSGFFDSDYFSYTINTDGYIGSTLPSSVSPWAYFVLVQDSIYWAILNSIRLIYIVCIFIALAAGVFLAVFFSKYNYRPVKSIVNMISENEPAGNEFELISRTYKKLFDENYGLRNTLSDQSVHLRSQFLLSCLKGKQKYYSSIAPEVYMESSFDGSSFLLLAFSIELTGIQVSDEYKGEIEFRNVNFFCVDNVFSELTEDFTSYKIEDGELLLYLLKLNVNDIDRWTKTGTSILGHICDLFTDELSIPLICAVSKTEAKFENIQMLYSEIFDLLEYKEILGDAGLILTSDIKNNFEIIKSRKEYYKKELAWAIQNGDAQKATQITTDLFSELSDSENSASALRISIFDYLNTVISAYNEVISEEELRLNLVGKIKSVFLSQDDIALKNNFIMIISYTCCTIQKQNNSSGYDLIQQIRLYVQENYQDPCLNIGKIADVLNKNPKYISRIFTAQTGISLLDLINETRMEKAKQILGSQNITVEQLSEMVGYTNVRTFRRSFTKIYKTTPKRYCEKSEE